MRGATAILILKVIYGHILVEAVRYVKKCYKNITVILIFKYNEASSKYIW